MSKICHLNEPELKKPVLIMGFAGWPNAGEVSTGTVGYLKRQLKAEPLAFISSDHYYDYAIDRPTATIRDGIIRDVKMPKNEFYFARDEQSESDLVLFLGHEPHSRWEDFCETVLDFAKELKIESIYMIGGTYDELPHWLEPQVSIVCNSEELKSEFFSNFATHSLLTTDYQGPVSIHSVLMNKALKQKIHAIGLWGHAPLYIQTGNIKVHKRIVEILSRVIEFPVSTSNMNDSIAVMDERILNLAEEDPKFKKFIIDMEATYGKWTPAGQKAEEKGTPDQMGKVISFKEFHSKKNSAPK